MAEYHLRMAERAIKSSKVTLDLLARSKYMTVAMCRGSEPYLVTVNHSFDKKTMCLYFHCAPSGKKLDFLDANPRVWGQVLRDNGYIEGKCDYAYRTVMFSGRASRVVRVAEKRRALDLMMDKLEAEDSALRKRLLTDERLKAVTVWRIRISGMSGKESVRR
jgi:hypothetical protein